MTNSIARLTHNRGAIVEGLRQAGYHSLANQVTADLDALAAEGAELDALRATLASVESDLCGAAALDNIAHAAYLDGKHG